MDKDPAHQIAYEGSHLIILCGAQYRTVFPEIVTPHNHQGPLIDHNTGEPYPWQLWENSASWTQSFKAVLGTVICSRKMTLKVSREKVSTSPLIGRRNLHPLSPRKTNKSLPASRKVCQHIFDTGWLVELHHHFHTGKVDVDEFQ